MKNIYILLVIALIGHASLAQVETVVHCSSPMGIAFHGNELYITEHIDARVSKVDVTQSNPVLINYITSGLIIPHDVAFHGSDLYISDFFGDKIVKIDVSSASTQPTLVLEYIDSPLGLVFRGNELYFSDKNSIWKFDVTDTNPTAVQVISGLQSPVKITFRNDELYIAETEADRIIKINVTDNPITLVDVLTQVSNVNSLKFKGDELYFTRLYDNAIWKIDITDQNPVPVSVATGVSAASALAFLDDELYIAERGTNRISKINTLTLATQNPDLRQLQLYPNPATSSFTVSGIQGEGNLTLYSISGVRLLQQPVGEGIQVNVDLSTGTYFAKIEYNGGSVIKKLIIK